MKFNMQEILDLEAADMHEQSRPDFLTNHWVPFKLEPHDEERLFVFRPLMFMDSVTVRQSYVKLGGQKVHLPSEDAVKGEDGWITRCGEPLSDEAYQDSENWMEAKIRDKWALKDIVFARSCAVQVLHTRNMGTYWKIPDNNVVAITFFYQFEELLRHYLKTYWKSEWLDKTRADEAPAIVARLGNFGWNFSRIDLPETRNTMLKLPQNEFDLNTLICDSFDPELWDLAVAHLGTL